MSIYHKKLSTNHPYLKNSRNFSFTYLYLLSISVAIRLPPSIVFPFSILEDEHTRARFFRRTMVDPQGTRSHGYKRAKKRDYDTRKYSLHVIPCVFIQIYSNSNLCAQYLQRSTRMNAVDLNKPSRPGKSTRTFFQTSHIPRNSFFPFHETR